VRFRTIGFYSFTVLAAVGCDGQPTAPTDAGDPPPDAGWSALDAGALLDAGASAPLDAGASDPADGGAPASDAGPLEPTPVAAGVVVDAPGAGDRPFGDPSLAVNGVRGGGDGGGSLDVYSIEYGGHLVLSWDGQRVRNGPGVDFVVFENPFVFGGGTFMDHAVVELSRDGETWVAFPHDYVAPDETMYSSDPSHWSGFAGVEPVRLHAEDHPVDPFDAAAAGGDRFDLAALDADGEAGRIRDEGFAYLRLNPAPDHDNPDTGAPFVRSPVSNGPDIDGVIARYVGAP